MRFLTLLLLGAPSVLAKCKCTPTDDCWPSASTWNTLNATVHGKLLHNQPIAEPCYPGADYNAQLCQSISAEWTNSTFIGAEPIGYCYPLTDACPPINATVSAYPSCDLGTAPVYAINATEADDVATGIKFAQENNVRLVIKNTGHDIVGRSQGYGSLMIWIKYIQNGVNYHETYTPSDGCPSNWTSSAFTVGGGYIWKNLYDAAAAHGRIVVGGSDPTVGAIGGYLQGGGHGPMSHYFGLGTDQVLEMTVVLASGDIVTANACQHPDLFTALRGGGGGTYGVVVSTTIKAHPDRPVLGHTLDVVPLNNNFPALLNISATILSKYPLLLDTGFTGDGDLISTQSEKAYVHSFGKLLPPNTTASSNIIQQAKSTINQHLLGDLLPYNSTTVAIQSTWSLFPSFLDYYNAGSHQDTTGVSDILLTSRMFDKPSLTNNTHNLTTMLHTIFAGNPNGTTLIELALIGGGQVLHPEPYTAVNPAWRKTYLLAEPVVLWPDETSPEEVKRIRDDMTFNKTDAMRALTPGMGSYVNEADGDDPLWKEDFFGSNYDWLQSIKMKYDPDDVFYCWRCVGSERWTEEKGGSGYGRLCQA
ncbi:isoamyl alcohol oxidase [Aspergillus sclerotiicarbonarius CBS 121057]|uniref:Isoamyl alcohol oxidase n=1 Tax=Aspergillus sclerotiicarbonarius (strain CBS 121057 / IBT 28362) TaxID=1448318 RepID=A0A319DZM3_ASPSB|nr:isoamyl alcohol oxidase [Aspergillus sclerotiicarbonarius CBS 121057]